MDAHEDVGLSGVRYLGSLLQARVAVVPAGEQDLIAALREQLLGAEDDIQVDVFLLEAGGSDGAGIFAAVAGIKDNQAGLRFLGNQKEED